MFLINTSGLLYTCIYLICFMICYYVVLYIHIEKIFRQGSIMAIRIGQVVLALILAYPLALAINELINNFKV